MTELDPSNIQSLLEWKRRVFDLYSQVRASTDARSAWELWRAERDDLFATHEQSPLTDEVRSSFDGLDYFDYDPDMRVPGRLAPSEHEHYDIGTSDGSTYRFTRFATVSFELPQGPQSLEVYWLSGYGGGVFLPFRDATAGQETYGAGRYLLDTVKGSDLGGADGTLVLDFNFAYNPSCSYDPRWVCPLAPPPNRLDIRIEAGEKHVER